mgnify:CR=1 FL=1
MDALDNLMTVLLMTYSWSNTVSSLACISCLISRSNNHRNLVRLIVVKTTYFGQYLSSFTSHPFEGLPSWSRPKTNYLL